MLTLFTKICGRVTYTLREEVRTPGPSGESRSIYWVLRHTTDHNNYHRVWDGRDGQSARRVFNSLPGIEVKTTESCTPVSGLEKEP